MGWVTVRNLAGSGTENEGPLIGRKIALADTCISRFVGLLGKSHLESGCGVLLQPSSGVHTVGMRFPIDVVGLDSEFRVLRLWPDLAPFRITSVSFKVRSVLELAAGEIAASNLKVGDQLLVERLTAGPGLPPDGPRSTIRTVMAEKLRNRQGPPG